MSDHSNSPNVSPLNLSSRSDDELVKKISAVRLDDRKANNNLRDNDGGSEPSRRTATSMSEADDEAQAVSSSLAASRATPNRYTSFLGSQTSATTGRDRNLGSEVRWEEYSDRRGNRRFDADSGFEETPKSGFDINNRQARHPITPYRASLGRPQWHGPPEPMYRAWRQPRFEPGHLYEDLVARDKLKPPVLGGRSKKDQLGSVNASWGALDEEGPKIYGMFEIEQDPPSRSTSPFKEEAPPPAREEVREAKKEALVRAREGTSYARTRRTAGLGEWSRGDAPVAKQAQSSFYTPADLDARTRDARRERYVDSAYGSGKTRAVNAHSAIDATPASTASRDVFGLRQQVPRARENDDGW